MILKEIKQIVFGKNVPLEDKSQLFKTGKNQILKIVFRLCLDFGRRLYARFVLKCLNFSRTRKELHKSTFNTL